MFRLISVLPVLWQERDRQHIMCWERNYSGFRLQGARIYTTLFPCNECTKALIQSGIKEIIYAEDKYADTASVIAAKKMMKSAGVSYRKYENQGKELVLYI